MTDLNRQVRRRTRNVCPTIRRRWVVALIPGDTFACKEEGRRKWYYAPLRRVCVQVVRWTAATEMEQKRKARLVKRGLRWRS